MTWMAPLESLLRLRDQTIGARAMAPATACWTGGDAAYKLSGPLVSIDNPDVAAVVEAAHVAKVLAVFERGLAIRLERNGSLGWWYVTYMEADGKQWFHEANGDGMVWRAHELTEFLSYLTAYKTPPPQPYSGRLFSHSRG